ncbi:hypothetical protein EVAR_63762_1 [Eumeta japonica]|uniref:Uncharacterized protein n=1 Tax=Eumeta variegata TaxID=151549 RepID=A0A4C1ZTG9_EUMVA|nr:hypothetical protein EVAR_63762_1 [Eumeta japonica]
MTSSHGGVAEPHYGLWPDGRWHQTNGDSSTGKENSLLDSDTRSSGAAPLSHKAQSRDRAQQNDGIRDITIPDRPVCQERCDVATQALKPLRRSRGRRRASSPSNHCAGARRARAGGWPIAILILRSMPNPTPNNFMYIPAENPVSLGKSKVMSMQATKKQLVTAVHEHSQPQMATSTLPASWTGLGYNIWGEKSAQVGR